MNFNLDMLADSNSLPPDDLRKLVKWLEKKPKKALDLFKEYAARRIVLRLTTLPPEQHDAHIRRFFRCFEPWPDWVLKIFAEVAHVDFPTIQRSQLEVMVRRVYFVYFDNIAYKLPTPDGKVFGAVVGHIASIIRDMLSQAGLAFAQKTISSKEHTEIKESISLEQFQEAVAPEVAAYITERPGELLNFNRAVVRAEANTFDKQGESKTTTLTPIYYEILKHWLEVEELSGPTALCEFLNPLLLGSEGDIGTKLERVKKLCQRMGIKFKPCQGTH